MSLFPARGGVPNRRIGECWSPRSLPRVRGCTARLDDEGFNRSVSSPRAGVYRAALLATDQLPRLFPARGGVPTASFALDFTAFQLIGFDKQPQSVVRIPWSPRCFPHLGDLSAGRSRLTGFLDRRQHQLGGSRLEFSAFGLLGCLLSRLLL